MTVPDTIEGAITLSAIDFVLSFALIGAIGVVLWLLPLLNRVAVLDDKDLTGGD